MAQAHEVLGSDQSDECLNLHARGGKIAMAHALSEPEDLERLISVDMSPARGAISAEFAQYIDGMREVQAAGVSSKKEADAILQKYEEVSGSFCAHDTVASHIWTDAMMLAHPAPASRACPSASSSLPT